MPLPRSSRVALLVSLILTLLFVAWSFQVLGDGRIPTFDRNVAISLRDAAPGHHFRREVMVVFTILGGWPTMGVLAVAGSCWQWWRGDYTLAAAWMAIVLSGALLNLAIKETLDRARPEAEWRDRAVRETNESFPSGHAMGSVIGYGMVGYAALCSTRRRGVRLAVLMLLALTAGLVGFSRIYLRAHWVSDVIGGYVIGAAWLSFCLAWVHARRLRLGAATPLIDNEREGARER